MNSVVLQIVLSLQVRADQLANLCRSVCIELQSYNGDNVTKIIRASVSVGTPSSPLSHAGQPDITPS